MNPVLILITLGIIIWYLWSLRKTLLELYRLNRYCSKMFDKIPGPHALPIIGTVYQFKINNREFTYQLEVWGRKYLPQAVIHGTGLLMVWIGPYPIVVATTIETLKPLLESNVNITKPPQYNKLSSWIGTGLLTSTGEKWFRRRKMLTPTFHFNILKGYQSIFAKHSEILTDILERKVGKSVDIFPYIKRCTLDIICETSMGTCVDAQLGKNNSYVNAVVRISELVWKYERFPWFWFKPFWYLCGYGFEFDRNVKLTNEFTRKVISERKSLIEMEGAEDYSQLTEEQILKKRLSFLDLLLNMQKANALTDEDIREEVDTFMFEGHDTTASGIAFTLWWLGQYPDYQERVHRELDEVFGDDSRSATNEDLKQLVYLEKCIKESLRLFPSVPFIARRVDEELIVGKEDNRITLPKGLVILIAPLTTARDFRHYERPDDFYPDHFDADKVAKRSSYSYVPFSAGPRNCIGQKFAIQEEKTVLSTIFRKFRVITEKPWPENRPVPELILKPLDSEGIRVRLLKRR